MDSSAVCLYWRGRGTLNAMWHGRRGVRPFRRIAHPRHWIHQPHPPHLGVSVWESHHMYREAGPPNMA